MAVPMSWAALCSAANLTVIWLPSGMSAPPSVDLQGVGDLPGVGPGFRHLGAHLVVADRVVTAGGGDGLGDRPECHVELCDVLVHPLLHRLERAAALTHPVA